MTSKVANWTDTPKNIKSVKCYFPLFTAFSLQSSFFLLLFLSAKANQHIPHSHFLPLSLPFSPITIPSLFKKKMSQFSFSSICKKKNESSCLPSHFFNICFFVFFSPYLLRLLSFLSPLFFTTTLLLLLSLLGKNDDSEFSDSKLGCLLSIFQTLVRKLSSENVENDVGFGYSEEFQAYLDVFQAPVFEVLEEACSEPGYSGDEGGGESRDQVGPMGKRPDVNLDENPIEEEEDDDDKEEAARPIAEEKSLENNTKLEGMFSQKEHHEVLEENDSESGCSGEEGRDHVGLMEDPDVAEEKSLENKIKLEDMFCQKGDKEVKPLDPESNKADESKEKMALRSGSKVEANNSRINAKESTATTNSDEEYFGTPERNWEYIGSYGSMRKEKDWRRTLACKLYEERHNVEGSEGMDLLWETYNDETETNGKVQGKGNTNGENNDNDYEEEEEEEEEKEKGMEGKYCCLRALKFSAGKMNLGIRRPNLVKISNALKSIGLLHHVGKHGRKGYR